MKTFLLLIITSTIIISQVGCAGVSHPAPPPSQLTFNSTPSAAASEGQPYSYAMTVTGAGQNAVTYHLLSGPSGASISGNALTWVPASDQARVANQFSVSATSGTSVVHQAWSVTPAGTVQGTMIVSYVNDSGTTEQPDDASQMTITASAPNANGSFTTLPGTGSLNGSYSIANVPGGHYWLQNGPLTYVWTDRSMIDSGHDTIGQPGRTYPALPTVLDLFLTDLNPWQNSDEQQLYVANSNTFLDYDWTLDEGATSLYQQVSWTNPLLDASHGDAIYLTQLVTTKTPSIKALGRAAEPVTGITQPDGTEVEVDAELENVSQDDFFRANVTGSAFAQLESAVNPSAVPDSSYLFLDVHPASTEYGWIGNTPDLIVFDGTGAPIRTDVDMGDVAYGNPYPEGWEPFLDYVHYVRVDYTAAGATNSLSQYAYLELQTTKLPTVTSPVAPAIGPVGVPKINGRSFFDNSGGVGTMPTLSWVAPALGTPTGYEVEIFHLYSSDGVDSQAELVGDLYATVTSIQVPPGLMTSGNSYYFRISAVSEKGVDFEAAPFRHSFPRAVAQTLSGVVTPANAAKSHQVRQSVRHAVSGNLRGKDRRPAKRLPSCHLKTVKGARTGRNSGLCSGR